MNFKKNIYQGYVCPTEFNNIYLPPAVQNLLIKNYCEQNNAIYKLSVNELNIKNSHMELFFTLKKIKKIDGLVMTSIYMLPQDKKNFSLFLKLYKKRKLTLMFIFENKKVDNWKEISSLHKKYMQYKAFNEVM